jgi:hypothetical protein
VKVAAPPTQAPIKGQSANFTQTNGTKPCQAPDYIKSCTGDELMELKQQLITEQSLATTSLDVDRIADDPAKAINNNSIDSNIAKVILMP